MNKLEIIKSNFLENQEINSLTVEKILPSIEKSVSTLIDMINNSGKLLTCGNGGSSGDAQHISSEFINRFEIERKELPAISLNSDTATMTSIANDYDYKYIFSKQINAFGKQNDILMAFTTSGNSTNILEAIKSAKKKKMITILISGNDGGESKKLLDAHDIDIIIPHTRTSRIQEMHLIIIHAICECIDKYTNT
ncbi:MAG: phosphoheptose isomerase [Gammaproteobacteria bacterium]|jgi:DnaA initiator-associating protein|nr:phosphoheptose isomerase [Gammaproteobacteria bacterium]|tara:strand:- start:643 stop:1227 length:585 start_codon:yes stop_codon:yes gene_type:complete